MVSDTHIDISMLHQNGGGGDLPEDFLADYEKTKETAYNSLSAQQGRRVTNLNQYGKVEMFRVYYAKMDGATGRECQFGALTRRDTNISAIGNFSLIAGYDSSKGGDYIDFRYLNKYGTEEITNKVKVCRIKNAAGQTEDKYGCVVVYFDTDYVYDICCYYMGSRYPEGVDYGSFDYTHINERVTVPSSGSVIATEIPGASSSGVLSPIRLVQSGSSIISPDPTEIVEFVSEFMQGNIKIPCGYISLPQGSYFVPAKCVNSSYNFTGIEIIFEFEASNLPYPTGIILQIPVSNPTSYSAVIVNTAPPAHIIPFNDTVAQTGSIAVQGAIDSLAGKVAQQGENLGGFSLWCGTQTEYDAIATKDANTLYHITD